MNVFLIGYRCTGKTSVGREMADFLKYPFVDTDARVVVHDGRRIDRIVREDGWPAFRLLEKEVVGAVCAADGQVIATGGGVVLDAHNVARMKRTGRVVLLTAQIPTILRRMREDAGTAGMRPALSTGKDLETEIRQTLTRRQPLYEAAMDIRVVTDSRPVGEITRDIVARLGLEPA
ncbi:MAG: shikimate kinase [Deltaproteobacteria bacterium]|nr:MAG: shikimate kinase [Deltaproteobacteria bacterium]